MAKSGQTSTTEGDKVNLMPRGVRSTVRGHSTEEAQAAQSRTRTPIPG